METSKKKWKLRNRAIEIDQGGHRVEKLPLEELRSPGDLSITSHEGDCRQKIANSKLKLRQVRKGNTEIPDTPLGLTGIGNRAQQIPWICPKQKSSLRKFGNVRGDKLDYIH